MRCAIPGAGTSRWTDGSCSRSGGKGKSFEQIKDIPGSYLAVDGTEVGRGNRIPLWLFGFLY